jgi:hypothetical protein
VNFLGVVKSFNPTLRELLLSDILIRFCERLPYAFVILWAMNHGGVNAREYSWLVAIEMITAMLCYIPVAHLADKLHGAGCARGTKLQTPNSNGDGEPWRRGDD